MSSNNNNKIETYKFWIQVFFSTVVLSLCTFQLVNQGSDKKNDAMYWGGLTGVLAYWLPSPSNSRESEYLSPNDNETNRKERVIKEPSNQILEAVKTDHQ